MLNDFPCYKRKSGTDSDEKVITLVRIEETEDSIKLKITRKEHEKSGPTTFKPQRDYELTLSGLSVDQILEIVELLEDWLRSETSPLIDIDIDGLEGFHEKNVLRRRSPITTETEFTDLKVTVSDQSAEFRYWDESDESWAGVEIPASTTYEDQVPENRENIEKLYANFYDFLTIEYTGEIDYFDDESPVNLEKSSVHKVEQIFNRFSEIVIPLQDRREDREPITMMDEYDVQYLLHGLLKLHFDDVRRESHTERHSSVSPRIDFLIQDETIGIEVKRASTSNQEQKIRTELSEDKEQYRVDTNIDTLLIFVYDPDKNIGNKAEFEDSFEEDIPQMETRVIVTR